VLVEVEHQELGKVKQIVPAIKMSDTPCIIEMPPPQLGQHTDEVLREVAGYQDAEIKSLHERKII
jgi:crotonobetainyl-CoA:carnitine CoA-transferase CaiB-like acyl-CoA transferase